MRISAWRIEMHVTQSAHRSHGPLTPAKAGVQGVHLPSVQLWILAFAGISGEDVA
jgi:hypothetical protein